jgi:O-antigen/teichoic acid export membrane protein
LLRQLLPGELGQEIGKAAGVVFFFQVAGAGLSYVTHIVLARILDADGYGVYAYVMAWTSLLAIPAGLGMTTALVRFVSQYNEEESRALLRGVTFRSWQMVASVGTAIALLASVFLTWGADRFSVPYAEALLVGIWIVPLRALLSTQVAMGRGLKRMTLAYFPGQVLRPLLLLVGIGLLLGLDDSVDEYWVLGLVAVTFLMVVLVQGTFLIRRILSITKNVRARFDTRRWLRISLPMLLVAGFLLLLDRTDVVMLGILAGAEDVGTYNAASRTASLASFILVAVNAIAAPTIASLYHQNQQEKLQVLASTVAHLIFWPSLLVVVALLLLAPFILGLFGEAFLAGQNILAVLAIGHLVNVGVGSVGYFMNMTGNQDEMARVVGVVSVVNIVLNAVAIPLYGALGAAFATAVSMAGWNVWLNRLVVARLSVRPSIVHAVRNLVKKKSMRSNGR